MLSCLLLALLPCCNSNLCSNDKGEMFAAAAAGGGGGPTVDFSMGGFYPAQR